MLAQDAPKTPSKQPKTPPTRPQDTPIRYRRYRLLHQLRVELTRYIEGTFFPTDAVTPTKASIAPFRSFVFKPTDSATYFYAAAAVMAFPSFAPFAAYIAVEACISFRSISVCKTRLKEKLNFNVYLWFKVTFVNYFSFQNDCQRYIYVYQYLLWLTLCLGLFLLLRSKSIFLNEK